MKQKVTRNPSDGREVIIETSPGAVMIDAREPIDTVSYAGMTTDQIVRALASQYAVALKFFNGQRGADPVLARQNAVNVWQSLLPEMIDVYQTRAFIACVAWGHKMKLLTPQDAKIMIFMAQTQLTLLKMTGQDVKPVEVPKELGGELFTAEEIRNAQPWQDPEKGGKKK